MNKYLRFFAALIPNICITALAVLIVIGYNHMVFPNLSNLYHSHPMVTFIVRFMRFLVIFSFILFYWSWITAVVIDPGSVIEDLKRRGLYARIKRGDVPYCLQHLEVCSICKVPCPHNASHCDECETCVLRYDHHCPILGQCVGDRNLKPFCLAFIYCSLCLMLIAIECIWYLVAVPDKSLNITYILTTTFAIYSFIGSLSMLCFVGETIMHFQVGALKIYGLNKKLKKFKKSLGDAWYECIFPYPIRTTQYAWPGVSWNTDYLL